MKIGVEDRRRVAVAGGLVLVAAVVLGRWGMAGTAVPAESSMVRSTLSSGEGEVSDPRLRLEALRDAEEASYHGSGRDIFWVVEERGRAEVRVETKVEVPPSMVEAVPPIPLSFFGFSRKSGISTVFLLKGEDVFLAREGDVVDRRYRVVRVLPEAVEIEDLLSERSERLVLRRG